MTLYNKNFMQNENVEMQWNDIKKRMLDTMSDLVGKVYRKVRKPWVTQEVINQMDERWQWKNVNNEEGKKNYRRLRNEVKRATDKSKKEYLDSVCDKAMEFQRTGCYDFTYRKAKELGWKQNHEIQT
jgi:nucleoside-diphosphate-sugar epimerase